MTDLVKPELQTKEAQFVNVLAHIRQADITPDNYESLMGILVQCKAWMKFYEGHRDQALNPTKQTAATIKGWFSPLLDTLKQVEDLLKEKATTYLGAQAGSRLTAAAAGQKPDPPDPAVEGISLREAWSFRVTNVRLLEEKFLKPNEPEIRSCMKELMTDDGPTPIPGVKFFRKVSVAVSPPSLDVNT